MTGHVHPRAVVKMLLQDSAPPRPLVMPLIFSWGIRVGAGDITRKAFLADATKIAHALHLMWQNMPCDAYTCYYDPLLVAEALGASLIWSSDGSSAHVETAPLGADGLPDGLRTPDEVASAGRVRVALEVVKRFKIQREGPLRLVGLSGPLSTAAAVRGPSSADAPPASALDICGSAVTAVARATLEAGTDVLLLHEHNPPADPEARNAALSQLETVVNITRFYEALPVVLLTGDSGSQFAAEIAARGLGCVTCTEWQTHPPEHAPVGKWGMALPFDVDGSREVINPERHRELNDAIRHTRPAVVTTAGEIPVAAHWKRFAEFCVRAVSVR